MDLIHGTVELWIPLLLACVYIVWAKREHRRADVEQYVAQDRERQYREALRFALGRKR